jgi:hypothetical protein
MLLARVVQTLSRGESGYNLAFGGLRVILIHTFSYRSNRLVGELPTAGPEGNPASPWFPNISRNLHYNANET